MNIEDACGQEIFVKSCNAYNALDGGKPPSTKPNATGRDSHGRGSAGTHASAASGEDNQKKAGTYASGASRGGKPNPPSRGTKVRDHTIIC